MESMKQFNISKNYNIPIQLQYKIQKKLQYKIPDILGDH